MTPPPSPKPLSIAVLASGQGTNFQALIDAIRANTLSAEICVLITNNPQAPAIERARRAGIPTRVLSQPSADALLHTLAEFPTQLLCLAGYMRILPVDVVQAFPNRIMNIHPSLLPAFPGLHAVRQALAHGATATGVTVHFVDTGIDTGPVILQEPVPIAPNDTEATLMEKIHYVEHRLYPKAVQLYAEGKLRVERGKVKILPNAT